MVAQRYPNQSWGHAVCRACASGIHFQDEGFTERSDILQHVSKHDCRDAEGGKGAWTRHAGSAAVQSLGSYVGSGWLAYVSFDFMMDSGPHPSTSCTSIA